jgi:hypothetical protein
MMTETPEANKPDFRNGFPNRDLGDGSMISGQADGEELVLGRNSCWIQTAKDQGNQFPVIPLEIPCSNSAELDKN